MVAKTRAELARVAKELAELPFHGFIDGKEPNIRPIVDLFPKWSVAKADRLWCAAFVYYCCVKAGFDFPCRPEGASCSLAGCNAWEEFAMSNSRIEYRRGAPNFVPEAGDIVLYDRVFCDAEHDHIGVVLEVGAGFLVAAEGNTFDRNISGIVTRPLDEHIRAFIRIPDGFTYK